jgi:hypothetical protein
LFVFLDETLLNHQLKKQISSLVIQTTGHNDYPLVLNELLFTNLVNMFSNLKSLDFNPYKVYHQIISMSRIPFSVYSSTLRELSVQVRSIDDCLSILDGRFAQLRVLNVKMMFSGHCRSISDLDQVTFNLVFSYPYSNQFFSFRLNHSIYDLFHSHVYFKLIIMTKSFSHYYIECSI